MAKNRKIKQLKDEIVSKCFGYCFLRRGQNGFFFDKYQVFLLYIQWIRIETFAMDKTILLPLKLMLQQMTFK